MSEIEAPVREKVVREEPASYSAKSGSFDQKQEEPKPPRKKTRQEYLRECMRIDPQVRTVFQEAGSCIATSEYEIMLAYERLKTRLRQLVGVDSITEHDEIATHEHYEACIKSLEETLHM